MGTGVYIHIPFCKSRCSYCDFATDVFRDGDTVERYVAALIREITFFNLPTSLTNDTSGYLIDTVYFGGGTPSLLAPEQVDRLLDAARSKFTIKEGAEITMELNPATVSPDSLVAYRKAGVNRASFGVQTFNDRSLKLLARGHDADDARRTFVMLKDARFENISFDLIAGLPGQTLVDWKRNLKEVISLRPQHISLYLLEIHEGTPLAEQVRTGRQPSPDEALAAKMYEHMLNRLTDAGYQQYEISNFSLPGFESRHNSKYWTLDPVFGFGVSAHSFNGIQRYSNERDTKQYVESIENRDTAEVMRENVDIVSEFIFLGLRMERGIDLQAFAARFGFDILERYRTEIESLIDSCLIQVCDNQLRLTRKGKLYSNEVFVAFV